MTVESRVAYDAPAVLYRHHYDRHDDLSATLVALWRITDGATVDSFDLDALLTHLLPGMRNPRHTWDDLADVLDRLAHLDGTEAVSIEQDRGWRHPNCVDSYARIADEYRNEIDQTIRHWLRQETAA